MADNEDEYEGEERIPVSRKENLNAFGTLKRAFEENDNIDKNNFM